MFPYSEQISQYTAAFPASVYTSRDVRNMEPDGVELVETGGVPPSLGPGQRLRLNLDQVPMEQAGMTVEVAGSPRTMIPYGEEPGPGEVAVSMTTGVMEFHESDADLSVTVGYRGKGTPIMAHLFHQLGRELAATQQAHKNLVGVNGAFGVPPHTQPTADAASATAYDVLRFRQDGQDTWAAFGEPARLRAQFVLGRLWLFPTIFAAGVDSLVPDQLFSLRVDRARAHRIESDGVAELRAGWRGPVAQSTPASEPVYLTSADSGRTFFSRSQHGSGSFRFYLPAWQPGLRYRFVRQHNGALQVFPQTGLDEYLAIAGSVEPASSRSVAQRFGSMEIEALPGKFEWDFGAHYAWVVRDTSS